MNQPINQLLKVFVCMQLKYSSFKSNDHSVFFKNIRSDMSSLIFEMCRLLTEVAVLKHASQIKLGYGCHKLVIMVPV